MTIIEKFKNILSKGSCTAAPEVYKSGDLKYSVTEGCIMELSNTAVLKKDEIEARLKQLIKKYADSPEKLIQYMKLKGINVYRIDNAAQILSYFGEEEGFIMPRQGLNAAVFGFIMSVMTQGRFKTGFSIPASVIFNSKDTEIYTAARALYKYYGYKNGLPGYDIYSQELFKKIYGLNKSKDRKARINNTSLKEILACRSALARDLESINFTLKLSEEYAGAKKCLEKLLKDKNAKV